MQTKNYFLLADDDEDDQLLFKEALADIDPTITCEIARNGVEALAFLQNNLSEPPTFIFLDLNMPIMNGLKCLSEIKKSVSLKGLPVIIYSTSAHRQYIDESMQLGALDFFVKPSDYRGLKDYLRKTAAGVLPGKE